MTSAVTNAAWQDALLSGQAGASPALLTGRLEVFRRGYADLDAYDRECWAELTRRAASPNIFVHDWLMDAAMACGDQAARLELLVVATQDGRWLGALPLVSEPRFGRWPVKTWRLWGATNQFLLTPLVLPQFTQAFWDAALGHLDARRDGHGALYCRLLGTEADVSQALLAHCRAQRRPSYLLETYDRAARLVHPLPDGPAPASKKSRKKLESRLRNLSKRLAEEHGALELSLHPDGNSPDAWLDRFLELERSGWKGRAGSALACDEANEQLFRTIILRGCEKGVAYLASLKAGGRTIAMTSWLVAGRQGFGFKMAYDETLAAYAPGQLLTQRVAELIAAEPDLDFDTCTAPDSQHCKYLWPDRRELFDCVVAVGSPARWTVLRLVMALRRAWHRLRALAAEKRGSA